MTNSEWMEYAPSSEEQWEANAMRWGGVPKITWEELQFRLLHCDECLCHYDFPVEGCGCECHGEEEEGNETPRD